jgi:hypothetical protein
MVVKIEIFNNSSYKIELDDFKKYFLSIMKDLKVEDALVNIIIVDNEEIKKINKEYRNIDNVTDVISFALEDVEFKTPFRVLGDIYISYDKVIEQALKYEHSEKRELYFLATHGLLHLLGYDHMNEEDEKVMFTLQRELLDKYDIKR